MSSARIIDKQLVRSRTTRAIRKARAGADFLLRRVVADLEERLLAVERNFGLAVAFAGQTAGLAEAVRASGKAASTLRLEIVPEAFEDPRAAGAVVDEEALPLGPESIDLFVSALALQWSNDLPGALLQIRRALRPDGLLLAAFLGGSTLHELRHSLALAETELRGGASPRVLPFAELRDVGALLQRTGFALPVVDRDVLTVRYDSLFDLMADLRAMGAANPLIERGRVPVPRALFLRAAQLYAERFSDADGRVRATFEVIWLSGWAPHESQQQPARRGSATVSLAEALRATKEENV